MLRWLIGVIVGLGLWLVAGPAAAADPPLTCPNTVNGTIEPAPTDPKQKGRINQGYPPSTCAVPGPAEPVLGQYGYEAHTFRNRSPATCMKATLEYDTTKPGGPLGLSAVAYSPSFDDQEVMANFKGTTGQPATPANVSRSFEFTIPPHADFTIVVNEVQDGGGGSYKLTVERCGIAYIKSISPNYGPTAGGNTVVIQGAGFKTGATVTFGSASPVPTRVDDEFSIYTTAPAHAAGLVNVTVNNPDTTSASLPNAYRYYDPIATTVALSKVAPTTTTSKYGEGVVFKAAVGPATPRRPRGLVDFFEGATVIAEGVPLNAAGEAFTPAITNLSVGAHSIVAKYRGEQPPLFLPGESAPLTHTVDKSNTMTVVSSSKNPSAPGEEVTFTATVNPVLPGAGNPTGTQSVTFRNGETELGKADLDANGRAVFRTALPQSTPPHHQITAQYGGDGNFNASPRSAAIAQQVKPLTVNMVLTATPPSPSPYGTAIDFVATVTGQSGPITSGNVTFTEGGTRLGEAALNSAGTATFKTDVLSVGGHTIVATLAAVPPRDGASKSLDYDIGKASTTLALTSSKNPSQPNETVTLTAKVTKATTLGTLVGGSVAFKQGDTVLGTVALALKGTDVVAEFNYGENPKLTAGLYSVTATYAGSETFDTSTASLQQQVGSGTGGDGGVDGGRDGGGTDSGVRPDAGRDAGNNNNNNNQGTTTEGGGCDCSSTGTPVSGLMSLLGGLGFALMLVRRRRG